MNAAGIAGTLVFATSLRVRHDVMQRYEPTRTNEGRETLVVKLDPFVTVIAIDEEEIQRLFLKPCRYSAGGRRIVRIRGPTFDALTRATQSRIERCLCTRESEVHGKETGVRQRDVRKQGERAAPSSPDFAQPKRLQLGEGIEKGHDLCWLLLRTESGVVQNGSDRLVQRSCLIQLCPQRERFSGEKALLAEMACCFGCDKPTKPAQQLEYMGQAPILT